MTSRQPGEVRPTDLTHDQVSLVTFFMSGYFDVISTSTEQRATSDELVEAVDRYLEMQVSGDLDA